MHKIFLKSYGAYLGLAFFLLINLFGFKKPEKNYQMLYFNQLDALEKVFSELAQLHTDPGQSIEAQTEFLISRIHQARPQLKANDLWLRYLEPVQYRFLNGALPVEWEAEVYEKWLPPIKRLSAGFTIAETYLEEENWSLDSLQNLFKRSITALQAYRMDSITRFLESPDHFYFANRLFLLNLASIYTTGFECMDSSRILPELHSMLIGTKKIHDAFGLSFPSKSLNPDYIKLYSRAIDFVDSSESNYLMFDHFTWIKEYVNPLFRLNQKAIRDYKLQSGSYVDYALNNKVDEIIDKKLYIAQNNKPLFLRVHSDSILAELRSVGKLLFHDPILSGNLERSCASCHIPGQFFTDTLNSTALKFNHEGRLDRNAPTLINARLNHLIMHDGQHRNLFEQLLAVHKNPLELKGDQKKNFKDILSCREYKEKLSSLAAVSSQKELSFDHVMAAIVFYYTSFDGSLSRFDKAVSGLTELTPGERSGFNLFMGKAQCGTCHFIPHFNGMKPPYTSNEFEVLGTPSDANFSALSSDLGRYVNHPVTEMRNAFRTNTLRNISRTKPYMHNGVFESLDQVIEFYNLGGGQGRGLDIPNQTLASDSLHLSETEKRHLIDFMNALDENCILDAAPEKLPLSRHKRLNKRLVGGLY